MLTPPPALSESEPDHDSTAPPPFFVRRSGSPPQPPRIPSRASSPVARVQSAFEFLTMTMMGQKGEGCREENQDRILVRSITAELGEMQLLAVADGVSRCPDGGGVAEYLLNSHLAHDAIFESGGAPLATLHHYLNQLNLEFYREFAQEPEMLESACTLSVALLEGSTAHCLAVGDSPIYLARKRGTRFQTRQLTVPDLCGRLLVDCFGAYADFELKEIEVELAVGDLLVVASDGVADSVEVFAALLDQYGPTPALLQAVEQAARNDVYFDDASLILARRTQ